MKPASCCKLTINIRGEISAPLWSDGHKQILVNFRMFFLVVVVVVVVFLQHNGTNISPQMFSNTLIFDEEAFVTSHALTL